VKDSGNLSVFIQGNSDIKIDARGVEELEGPKKDTWKVTEVKEEETGEEDIVKKNGIFNTGEGKHTLTVTDTFNVNVQYQ
jgi:phage pi2 protein 07